MMGTARQDQKPAIQVTDLSVAYHRDPVLRGINLQIPAGLVMGVVGPNGSGKSTLIKSVLGLVSPLRGRVEIFGRSLPRVRQRIGYLPQHTSVDWDFPTVVSDVVTMGTYGRLGWLRRPGAKEKARVSEAMAATGVTDLAERQIGQLSGGQRQRVFLARTLAQQPDIYVMDEPFQGVDVVSQQAIVEVMHQLRASGATIVLVHHDLATVPQYCDQVSLINRELIASGPVEEVFTPENLRRTYDIPGTGFLEDLIGGR